MPGITRRKYVGEIQRFNKSLRRPLKLIQEILPYEYDAWTILKLFKELYPYEWETIEQRYQYNKAKDNFLKNHGKEVRYKAESPVRYLFNLQIVKNSLTDSRKNAHKSSFNEEIQLEKIKKLRASRQGKIEKRLERINQAKQLIQEVEPLYIDAFIVAYHQKDITTEGKIEIFKELTKYDCEKSREFFYKLNDSERNDQIRNLAFQHLQSIGRYVKLRKKFMGKQKNYATETSDFEMTPTDLVNRINANQIQNKKVFDVFVSHSSKDKPIVQKLIKALNKHKLNNYCDWTSDSDFLKRELVSEYTKAVLQKRLEQSKILLFVRTQDSIQSDWVKFELEFFKSLRKPIRCIDFIGDNANSEFDIIEYDNEKELIVWN